MNFSSISLESLDEYAISLRAWSHALAANADILLYGCEVASGERGQAFVKRLSELAGSDVAASRDNTGIAALGGDWELEFSTGTIETGCAFLPWARASFRGLLATANWTNPNGGLWSNASNWSTGAVPAPEDDVFITLPRTYTVTY